MRQPIAAGKLYEKGIMSLTKQVESCFEHERGPGVLPGRESNPLAKAVIVPHSDITLSGPCAAWAYKVLAESEKPDVYILLGSSPTRDSGFSIETIQMPAAEVRMDQHLARALEEKGHIKRNEAIHTQTAALELQLPFLQFVHRVRPEGVKILPILIGEDLDMREAAVDLKEVIGDLNRKVTFVIAAEFTHFGTAYGHVPFSVDVPQSIAAHDKKAFKLISGLDADGYKELCQMPESKFSGVFAVELLLRTLPEAQVELEAYYTSGDLLKEYKKSASFASIIFR